MRARAAGVLLACSACGCVATAAAPQIDPGLAGLALAEVHPALLLPGTSLDLVGASFVAEDAGLSRLVLSGTFTADGVHDVSLELPARFVSATRLSVGGGVDGSGGGPTALPFDLLGGRDGHFSGSAFVQVDSAIDHRRHGSDPVPVELDLRATLAPRLDSAASGAAQANAQIALGGDGFLLGGAEGNTVAVLDGCFLRDGVKGPCDGHGAKVQAVEIAAAPSAPWDRKRASFPFAPSVAGIQPGVFTGTVRLVNQQPGGKPVPGATSVPLTITLRPPSITAFAPRAASLGQYTDIHGGGFVGGEASGVTLVHLIGSFAVTGTNLQRNVDLLLIPRFVDGGLLRYVIDEADELGHLVDLRTVAGTFTGTAAPLTLWDGDQIEGAANPVTLGIAPVKQVVFVNFQSSYVASLRGYGLGAADQAVRRRVLAVGNRDYAGVNVEWRQTPPTDFALYAEVDIGGPDPNSLGLLGYDNTPGKDVGNARLFDRIGGVNATTQSDGFPGYGGVFADQFLGFSAHPPPQVAMLAIGDSGAAFDAIFDPLRADRGGTPATPAELAGLPDLDGGSPCPAADRPTQIQCAIFVLGNLIGTTMTHETGHSLGLANPDGDGFHDPGDLPNRLMESGGDRPFEERTELSGQGPGVFCDSEYDYLKRILPGAATPDPKLARPGCDAP